MKDDCFPCRTKPAKDFQLKLNSNFQLKIFLLATFAGFFCSPLIAQTTNFTPLMVAPLEKLRGQIKTTIKSTKPDFTVFVPEVNGTEMTDRGNEHFLVFDGPEGSLMTVWTQSSHEGAPDQHIVFSRSTDKGRTWSKPRMIAGAAKPGEGHIASWAFPLVSKRGRIYVLYSQHIGKFD